MNLQWTHNTIIPLCLLTSCEEETFHLSGRQVQRAVRCRTFAFSIAGNAQCDLELDEEDSYIVKAADRFHCLDLQWCCRLYYKLFKAEYGTQSGESMASALMRRLESWNGNQSNTVAGC